MTLHSLVSRPKLEGVTSVRFDNMVAQSDEKHNNRPNLLRTLMERRRQKKRAQSLDETLGSSNSSLDRPATTPRNRSPAKSVHNDNRASRDPITIVEEDDADDNLLKDLLYKQEIALANRVTALKAQQQLCGKNHPDVLFSLQSLAAFHRRRGEHTLSQRVLEEIQLRGEQAQDERTLSTIPSEISFRS